MKSRYSVYVRVKNDDLVIDGLWRFAARSLVAQYWLQGYVAHVIEVEA
jgi:hypothetical protein